MAIDIRTISISYYSISKVESEENEGKVIASNPIYAFEDNKVVTDKRTGTRYTLLFERNKYQTLDLKVEEKKPAITQEDIDNSNDGYIPVIILGFSAQLYQRDGKILISAKAERLEVIG